MKALVKYHNDLNSFSFNGFNEKELDLFFAICYKIKEKGTDIVEFDFSELKDLLGLRKKTERLKEYILSLNKKLLSMKCTYHIELDVYDSFVFFTRLKTNFRTGKLEITLNLPFKFLLNDLVKNYTKFDLIDFVSLKSTYSKNLFKLLKQWETIKEKKFSIDEFRETLEIPDSYKMSDVDKRVLTPIMTELPQYFFNLKLEKIKTGKKVTSLKFSWNNKEKLTTDIKDVEVVEIEISEQLNKAIEKAKKNRFIEKLLTLDNIEILTNMFQENDLIKGLLWAYKEVRQDISTLNYLIKTIRTGAEKKEIKIKVKKEKIQEIKQENLFNEDSPIIEKIDITREEFNKKYKEYLAGIGLTDNVFLKRGFEKSFHIVEVEEESIQNTKVFTEKDIPENELLGKNGKKLTGAALQMRINKILNDKEKYSKH